MGERKVAIAIGAHPDDIEFKMAGTLMRLKELGWETHYFNIARGNRGSGTIPADELAPMREREARAGAEVIGARFHPPVCDDLEILYTVPLLRKIAAVVRSAAPDVVLTHPPVDYMEDHANACRLAVTAAFSRGMKNFPSDPEVEPHDKDVAVYHAMPHGLRCPLGQTVVPAAYVNVSSVIDKKTEALSRHESQQEWLAGSQGMSSYVQNMRDQDRQVGRMSGLFDYAEGWFRRSHIGFSCEDVDILAEGLGDSHLVNVTFERHPPIPSEYA